MVSNINQHKLQCDCCYALYDNVISLINEQAADCASNFFLHENYILIASFYGSTYDTMLFISNGWEVKKENGLICDKCIEDLLSKSLIQETDYDKFVF